MSRIVLKTVLSRVSLGFVPYRGPNFLKYLIILPLTFKNIESPSARNECHSPSPHTFQFDKILLIRSPESIEN